MEVLQVSLQYAMGINMKKLVCFDMDMTLLDHATYSIPESAMKALDHLRAEGHIIVLASGRDMENEFSRPLAELVHPDAIVHANGLKVTIGNEKIYEHFMEKSIVKELLEFAEEHHICIGYNLGDIGYFVNKERVIEREVQVFGSCDRKFGDHGKLLDASLHALAVFGTLEQVQKLERAFPLLKFPMFSGNVGADIVDKNTSKAVGIEALLTHYQLGWDDVIAFGDSMNDMEMIHAAGCGIAMGNAIEPLKKAADFVTKAVNEDGIWYGLQKLGLL